MRIKEIHLKNFKRFTDLTIKDLPRTAKLIVLVGPNGSGKTSAFEGFNYWHKRRRNVLFQNYDYFAKKNSDDITTQFDDSNVKIESYDMDLNNRQVVESGFYFRTAYRNEPNFQISGLSKQRDPTKDYPLTTFMNNEALVSENYQRLVSQSLEELYDNNNDGKTVECLRNELLGRINNSLINVFEDLQLSTIGNPLVNGSFYFTKGQSKNFDYKNLSAGEKSAFDLILDIIIKSKYYQNAVYCIDEPEIHMHTSLQSRLLRELYSLIPGESQLWISTHSIGMLQEAREIEQDNKGTVCFLDFGNLDFDDTVTITPSRIDSTIWKKFLDLSLGEFSKLVAPKTVVFCEGDPIGSKNKDFDSNVYERIFSSKYPDVSFVSVGSCSVVEDDNNLGMNIVKKVLEESNIIRLTDRDDKSDDEIAELETRRIKVLKRRTIESYLLDEEIIRKLCKVNNKEDKETDCINAVKESLKNNLSRRKPQDDYKSASGEIYNSLKRILSLTQCGNKTSAFLRDTMAPLITEDTKVFKELDEIIFGDI